MEAGTSFWENELDTDATLFGFIQHNLYVAVVCDILDELGYRNQAMHQRLRPLLPDVKKCGFIGRARTFRWMETNHIAEDPYGLEIEAMDDLKAGDVVIHSTDYGGTNAPWGELMSTIAKQKAVAGCVCDSQIRDCVRIMEMEFPVYYSGIRPLDSKGRAIVIDYDVPVQCGEVLVNPGDIVFADFDGIVVIPRSLAHKVVEKAYEKMNHENLSRKELLAGKTLREVYDKYQAL
ncbi:MAG: RraA family protein [Chitinophagaceae bacterium]|nr:RraA family protein [Chitinophagaceae bacterium]